MEQISDRQNKHKLTIEDLCESAAGFLLFILYFRFPNTTPYPLTFTGFSVSEAQLPTINKNRETDQKPGTACADPGAAPWSTLSTLLCSWKYCHAPPSRSHNVFFLHFTQTLKWNNKITVATSAPADNGSASQKLCSINNLFILQKG